MFGYNKEISFQIEIFLIFIVFGICKIKSLLLQPFASLINGTGKTTVTPKALIISDIDKVICFEL